MPTPPWRALAASLVASCWLAGCPTLGQFRDLEQEMRGVEQEQARQKAVDETIENRLKNLHGLMKEQSGDLQKSGNTLASRVEALEIGLRKLEGKDEEIDHEVGKLRGHLQALAEELDDRFGLSVAPLPQSLPKDAEGMMAAADAKMSRGLYRVARAIYREVLRRYPKHAVAPRAQLRAGESYAREKKYGMAVKELTSMETRYGKTPEMAEAYLLVGAIFEEQGDCKKARAVYRLFVDRARKHPKREAIQKRIKDLRKNPKCR